MARSQSDGPSQRLMDIISGIVFLGCPHVTYDNKDLWPCLSSLLKYVSRLPRIVLAQAELEVSVLADVCQGFEQSDINVPIISAYETMKTRLPARVWQPQKSLVGQILFHSMNIILFAFLMNPAGQSGTRYDRSEIRIDISCGSRSRHYMPSPEEQRYFWSDCKSHP
jgi:hypothetical protein